MTWKLIKLIKFRKFFGALKKSTDFLFNLFQRHMVYTAMEVYEDLLPLTNLAIPYN